MDVWDAIRARRNVRRFDDRPVSEADLQRILEAGRRSPSARNRQRWDFVVVTDRADLERLSEVWRGAGHVARSAATIALVAPDTPEEWPSIVYDLGQVTMSMMLAAAGLGIGTGHASVADQAAAREVLGIPEDRVCAYLVALGHPAGRPLAPIHDPDRRPFADVVHRGRWGVPGGHGSR